MDNLELLNAKKEVLKEKILTEKKQRDLILTWWKEWTAKNRPDLMDWTTPLWIQWPEGDRLDEVYEQIDKLTDQYIEIQDAILALEPESAQEDPPKEVHEKLTDVFPCDEGTAWEDIRITLVDDQNNIVSIKTPKGKRSFGCHSLGLADNRTKEGKPDALWSLLKILCKNQGILSRENQQYDRSLPVTASKLNKHLQKIFEIESNIFDSHYKKDRCYRSKIMFSDRSQVVE